MRGSRPRGGARWPPAPKIRPHQGRGPAVSRRSSIDGGNHPREAARDDIRQRKRPRFLFRYLPFRGASIRAVAGAVISGRGRLFCSNRPGLKRAYPPALFSGKLVLLATRASGSVHRLVAGRGWRLISWVCDAKGANSGISHLALLFALEVANVGVRVAAARTPGIGNR
jgi:hypothetical protein